jgi:replication-associated recombination protein RarA
MENRLITKYRPKTFEEVIGQKEAVAALQSAMKRAQAFALTGPSGTGKTTLARIAASVVKCSPSEIMDVDAASNTGVEKMREVTQLMQYKSVGGGPRVAIIDEAHRLSGNAWDSMLKTMEEPRNGALWFLCTTNVAKVPKTIMTRCAKITLKPVKDADIEKLVMKVVKAENMKIGDGAIDAVIAEAGGSPRQALSHLVVCESCQTRREALAIIRDATESDATIELCRFLTKPGSWASAMAILEKIEDANPEGIRIIVMNYFGKVMKGAKNDRAAMNALNVLEAFSQPYNGSEGTGPLMVSLGRAVFDGGN